MPKKYNIDEIVDKAGFEAFLATLKATKEMLGEILALSAKTTSAKGESASEIRARNKAIEDAIIAQKGLNDVQKQEIEITVKAKQAKHEYVKSLVAERTEKREVAKLAALQKIAVDSEKDSYNQLSAQYRLNVIELNKMSEATRLSTDAGRKLTEQTEKIREKMSSAKKATGDYTLDVGKYEDGFKKALGTMSAFERKQQNIQNLGSKPTQMGFKIPGVDPNMSLPQNATFSNVISGYNAAGASVRELKQELKELKSIDFAGKSVDEVKLLKTKMGDLIDTIGDLQTELKIMGTENAAVVVGGLKFIAAGVEGVVGSLSLMGVESETVQRLESKMTSLIAVTQALAEIEDVVSSGKLKAIGIRIKDMALNAADTVQKWANTTATTAQATAETAKARALTAGSISTRVAAAAQWLWNAALAANPIGLVVVGIAALSAAIYGLTKLFDSNTERYVSNGEALKRFNESVIESDKLIKNYKKSVTDLSDEYDVLIGKLTDTDAQINEINRERANESAKLRGKQVDDITAFNNKWSELDKERGGRSKANQMMYDLEKKKLSKRINDENLAMHEVYNKKIDIINKKSEIKNKESLNKKKDDTKEASNDLQKEINDIEQKLQKEYDAKQKEDEKVRIERQKKIDENWINYKHEQYVKSLKAEAAIEAGIEEARLRDLKIRSENIQRGVDMIESIEQAAFNKRMEHIDKEIEASKNRQTTLRELASKGSEDANKNLAFEEAQQIKLEAQKRKQERMQRQIELGGAIIKSYNEKLASGDKNALQSTIKDAVILQSFIKSLSSYKKGTFDTGNGGDLDNDGGFLAKLHKKEAVIDADKMDKVRKSGITSNEEMVNFAINGKKNFITASKTNHANDELKKEIVKLQTIIKEKPVNTGNDYEKLTHSIVQIVETSTSIRKNHKRLSKLS